MKFWRKTNSFSLLFLSILTLNSKPKRSVPLLTPLSFILDYPYFKFYILHGKTGIFPGLQFGNIKRLKHFKTYKYLTWKMLPY